MMKRSFFYPIPADEYKLEWQHELKLSVIGAIYRPLCFHRDNFSKWLLSKVKEDGRPVKHIAKDAGIQYDSFRHYIYGLTFPSPKAMEKLLNYFLK